MEVNGPRAASAAVPVRTVRPAVDVQQPAATSAFAPTDQVEISSMGKMLDDVSRTPGLREQRLAQIKSAIEAGTYDTPEKLELALSRMLDRLATDDTQS